MRSIGSKKNESYILNIPDVLIASGDRDRLRIGQSDLEIGRNVCHHRLYYQRSHTRRSMVACIYTHVWAIDTNL